MYDIEDTVYAFLTLGSMTADAAYGSDDAAPELIRDKRDGGWRLWETIAAKADDCADAMLNARATRAVSCGVPSSMMTRIPSRSTTSRAGVRS
ncbi:oleate hydratase [Streptomyces sp. ME18-1-4]|uniref:oleate hydratase n=1 Tax=Streptomyces sp. ME18-1-4 TaxID=3028685 RepID=UPI0029AF7C21|nr:oleate hydratase [Streptomyces sp. ME18-1-4]MDX3243051.1 oleate hydratase [Streptomyces sp. ME18-1-4]